MPIQKHSCRIEEALSGRNKHISPVILDSWRRSNELFRLDPRALKGPYIEEHAALLARKERMGSLLPIATVALLRLHKQLKELGHHLLLADPEGVVVESINQLTPGNEHDRFGLRAGARWTENIIGTNAIGLALSEKRGWTIHHDEHFWYPQEGLTCSASPIFDYQGELLGALNATALWSPQDKRSQYPILQMVESVAHAVEDAQLLSTLTNEFIVRFSEHHQFMNAGWCAILAVNSNGRIVGANSRARHLLLHGAGHSGLIGAPLERFIEQSFDTLLAGAGKVQPVQLRAHAGVLDAYLSIQLPPRGNPAASPQSRRSVPAADQARQAGRPSLIDLAGADPKMVRHAQRLQRVLNRDIPVLLLGETGTGKEVFAGAIHRASQRADKAFVAINCGAIPESLIESELFGYVAGTFTGASKGGAKGKIELAHQGTLFLDEIGDMPLPLQTRLLRVISEKEVLPLGADKPIPVDIAIISATHRNLEALVAEGKFREDLFYRLRGLVIDLVPLRDREDKVTLAQSLLHAIGLDYGHAAPAFSDDALQSFCQYTWPGNIRQLIAALKTGLALSETGILTRADLEQQIGFKATLSDSADTEGLGQSESTIKVKELPDSVEERVAGLRSALKNTHWNVTKASEQIGISRATAYRWMQRYGIQSPNSLDGSGT